MALVEPRTSFPEFVKEFADAIGQGIGRLLESSPRLKALEGLSALSDAELAQRGLTRDTLVQHVFGQGSGI